MEEHEGLRRYAIISVQCLKRLKGAQFLDEQAQQPISRTGDPWETGVNQIEKYDNELCKGWKEHIDTLLVFVRRLRCRPFRRKR